MCEGAASHGDGDSRPALNEGCAPSVSRLLSRLRMAAPVALALAGFGLIAFGQYSVNRVDAPFDWPLTGWLNLRLERNFHTRNALAFGIPLFVAGGLLFALFVPRVVVGARRIDVPSRPTRLRLIVVCAIIGFAFLAWAWLNVRLYEGHYDPTYRWIFLVGIVAVSCALIALDHSRGCLSARRPNAGELGETAVVAALTGTFIGINIRDLDNWRYAIIGDELEFYNFAHQLARGFRLNWFTQDGPYHQHPIMSSAWQALSLRLFGDDGFGWKMGSLIAIAVTIPMFYWLARQLLGVRPAMFATLFLASSHYLFAYAHTGYDNVFPLFPTVTALALVVAGVRRNSYALLFVSGLFAGMGFYTFYSSRAAIAIVALVMLSSGWRGLRPWVLVTVAAGFACFVTPIFATDGWTVISEMFHRSATNANDSTLGRLLDNVPRAVLAFNFSRGELHYVAGALMDSVTVTLAVAGLFVSLVRIRHTGYRAISIWFVVAATVAGVFSEYGDVTISRLHYVLPAIAAFAGIGADRLVAALSETSKSDAVRRFVGIGTFVLVAPVVFIVNGQHFFGYSASHSPTIGETVVLRELETATCKDQPLRNVVYRSGPDQLLDLVLRLNGLGERKPLQMSFRYAEDAFMSYPGTGGSGCVLVVDPNSPENAAVVQRLISSVRSPDTLRTVTDLTGRTRVLLVLPETSAPGVQAGNLGDWRTGASGSSLVGVVKGQEKNAIKSLDSPRFQATSDARLFAEEPVLVLRDGTSARAYPLRFVMRHVVVNDDVAGAPVAVTFDPISGSARAFSRRSQGGVLQLAGSGLFRGGNALLFDRESETWWQQMTGEAVVGPRAGERLEALPSIVTSWSQFVSLYRDGVVLQVDPQTFSDGYRANPYLGYDAKDDAPPLFTLAPLDDRLPALRRVAVVEVGSHRVAVPYSDPSADSVFEIAVGGQTVSVLFLAETVSVLDQRLAAGSRRVGSAAVFRTPPGLHLTARGDGQFVDENTGAAWTHTGSAEADSTASTPLEPMPAASGFWFAVAAAYPGISIAR